MRMGFGSRYGFRVSTISDSCTLPGGETMAVPFVNWGGVIGGDFSRR
jgi:hypothetical protein